MTRREPDAERRDLGHGSRQRLAEIANSLTTTSSVVAALNSVLAGSLASDLGALFDGGPIVDVISGVAVSLDTRLVFVRGTIHRDKCADPS